MTAATTSITHRCVVTVITATLVAVNVLPAQSFKTFGVTDMCNKTIEFYDGQDGGLIDFRYPIEPPYPDCYTKFRTSRDSQLLFWFLMDSSPELSHWSDPYCPVSLTIRNVYNYYTLEYCQSTDFEGRTYSSYSNELDVDLLFNARLLGPTYISGELRYKMVIGRYTTRECNYTNRVYCHNSRCLPRDLACVQNYDFCTDGTQFCIDVVQDGKSDVNTIIVAITGVLVVICLGVALLVFAREKSCCRKESLRTTAARSVTADELTSRGVTSNDPDAEVDYTTYEPPPLYDSLENIHNVDGQTQTVISTENGQTQTDHVDTKTEDLPPEYREVVSNQAYYNVSFHM